MIARLAQTWLIIVTGLGGSPQHRAAFEAQAAAIAGAAQNRFAVPADRIVRLGERTNPRGTADELVAALTRVAARADSGATVIVVLIGHGTASGGDARFNLPGPDITAGGVAAVLRAFRTQEVVVINAASASGPWAAALAGPRRTIITATRSDVERHETVFPRFLAEAFTNTAADLDHDDRLSVREIFEYTRRSVEQFYQQERRLQTEHALIEDDGNGRGSLAADSSDGRRAALLYVGGAGGAAAAAADDPALRQLMARRDSLERAISALRGRQAAMDSTAYATAMEQLLLQLAQTGRAIREREPRRP